MRIQCLKAYKRKLQITKQTPGWTTNQITNKTSLHDINSFLGLRSENNKEGDMICHKNNNYISESVADLKIKINLTQFISRYPQNKRKYI